MLQLSNYILRKINVIYYFYIRGGVNVKYILSILLVIFSSGCMQIQSIDFTKLQQSYIGRPISDIETKLGSPNNISSIGDKKQYSWLKNQTRWVDIAQSQSIAGTQYINGRNVATTIKSPPIRTMKNVYCSFNVLTDKAGKIVELSQTSSGLDCTNYYSKL